MCVSEKVGKRKKSTREALRWKNSRLFSHCVPARPAEGSNCATVVSHLKQNKSHIRLTSVFIALLAHISPVLHHSLAGRLEKGNVVA